MHTLRRSIATHLLEKGTDLRYLHTLLGHGSSKTTGIYAQASTKALGKNRCPLDDLKIQKNKWRTIARYNGWRNLRNKIILLRFPF